MTKAVNRILLRVKKLLAGRKPDERPDNWYNHHTPNCKNGYDGCGCSPYCPSDTYERTGVWIGG